MNIMGERCAPTKFPWIFYSQGEHYRDHTFYSLSERRVYYKCIKEMVDHDTVCSLHGWLILSNQIDRRSLRLFNPVSMETIQLPLLPTHCYKFCTLSCDPKNQNCIVMLIKTEKTMSTCYFCRPTDVAWTVKNLDHELVERSNMYLYCDNIQAVGCYKGQICIFTGFWKILLLDANPPFLTVTDLGRQQLPCLALHHWHTMKYLVECDGELFVIGKFHLRRDAYDFFVGKLDIREKTIVVLENLGGRTFFLSSSSSVAICSAENHGIKENTIYFTNPSNSYIYSFDMQKKVLTFSLPCPNAKRDLVPPQWILLMSPDALCKLDCKVDIISPLQINKSTVLSIGKDCSSLAGYAGKWSRFATSDWSKLPPDVLILIAEKLSYLNCARISTVCKGWKSTITWTHGCPIFLYMPFSSIEAFHLMNKSRHNVSILENPENLIIQGAKYGWLLVTRYGFTHGEVKIFFLNPLTSQIINLPNLSVMARSFCFTSLPTSSSCSVIAISEIYRIEYPTIYHISRGMRKWVRVRISTDWKTKFTPYSNPVFHGGKFYWILICGNFCTYDMTKKKVTLFPWPQSICKSLCISYLFESGERPQSICKSLCISYLFESGEKLMFVCSERQGDWFRVYELDDASMAWKEVNTLDNKVVFLSRNSSLVTEIQNLEDMIFFNRFVSDYQPLVYSLKTGELGVYGDGQHIIRDFCDIPENQIKSAWIVPNTKQHSTQELSWYNSVLLNTIKKSLHSW